MYWISQIKTFKFLINFNSFVQFGNSWLVTLVTHKMFIVKLSISNRLQATLEFYSIIIQCSNSNAEMVDTSDSSDTVCYEDLGCITTDLLWYDVVHRPINLMPLARQIISTTFSLYTRQHKTEVVFAFKIAYSHQSWPIITMCLSSINSTMQGV